MSNGFSKTMPKGRTLKLTEKIINRLAEIKLFYGWY